MPEFWTSLGGRIALKTYTAAVRDYPHSTPLKTGERPIENCRLEFADVKPIHKAFAPMVRELKYDVSELAVATYLQAREAGKEISALPVVLHGNFHHHSLTHWPGAAVRGPGDLVGQRVGVRAYTQTTGLWVRGALKEDYGIDAGQITWVTTEGPHVAEYVEPENVERTSGTLVDLLRDGDVAAAVMGPVTMDGEDTGLVPVIENWEEAEQDWFLRHSAVPINHLLTVRTDVLRDDPDAVRGIYAAFAASIDAAKPGGPPASRPHAITYGLNDALLSSLQTAIRYAREQHLIRNEFPADELFADVTPLLDA